MLIRTQDRKHLVNLNSVTEINVYDGQIFASFPFSGEEDNCISLGNYSTDDNASKVLDMLQDKYCTLDAASLLFQMPQEREVM